MITLRVNRRGGNEVLAEYIRFWEESVSYWKESVAHWTREQGLASTAKTRANLDNASASLKAAQVDLRNTLRMV